MASIPNSPGSTAQAVVALRRGALELSIQSEISANLDAVLIGHEVTAQNRRDT